MLAFNSSLGTALITLEVGEAKVHHHVHKDLLTRESPYFDAMFRNKWKEATSSTPIPFHQVDSKIMPYFLDWLYFRSARQPCCGDIGSATCCNCGGACATIERPGTTNLDIDDLTAVDDCELEALLARFSDPEHATTLYIFTDQFDFPSLRQDIMGRLWCSIVEDQ